MTTSRFDRLRRFFSLAIVALPLLASVPGVVLAQDDLDQDFEFMSGLVEWGMADYADKALEKLLLRHPEAKDRAKVVRALILNSERKMDEAAALAKELPAGSPQAQSIKLAVANSYYKYGEVDKAKALYEEFFKGFGNKAPEDPDLRRHFQESAYKFAQMLELAGDRAGAAGAYDRVLLSKPGRDAERPLMAEQAQLYVDLGCEASGGDRDKYLGRANKLSEELLWGGIDLWFGKSIITLANARLCQGDKPGAEKYLGESMDILKQIDKQLKDQDFGLSMSPMAGARFLRGTILEDQAGDAEGAGKKEEAVQFYGKALKEYYNVFARYGDSDWGPKAGVKASDIKAKLEDDYGKEIKITGLPDRRNIKVGPQQFRMADTLFQQKEYAKAVEEYLVSLNQFPESDQTPRVLTNIMKSYAELDDELMVRVVAEYAAERFTGREEAGTALLLLGKHYFDAKKEPMYMYAYETYLEKFPEHSKAAAILFTLAGLRKKAGDEEGRMLYLEQIIADHKEDAYYLRALKLLGWDSYINQDFERAAAGLETFVAESQPGPDKAKAQFALADSYFRLGKYVQATKEYKKLTEWLDPSQPGNPYDTSAEAAKENAATLEKAAFQTANAFSLIQAPAAKQAAVRTRALQLYDGFLSANPGSSLAPKAMAGKGRLLLAMERFDEATAAFNELSTTYPDTEEGKSSLYSLIKAAVEVGKMDVARDAFAKMLQNADKYSPAAFLRVGQLMLDNEANQEAVQAFQQIPEDADRALVETALFGLGRAYFNLGDHENAIRPLATLMERFPKSGLFYQAKFILAESYLATGQFDVGVEALVDIFKFAKDEPTRNEANYKLGLIYKEQGDKQKAYASFQRIVLLSDPANKELRPWIEKSLWQILEIGEELGQYQDLVDACDQFLQMFPRHEKIDSIRQVKRNAQMKALTAPKPAEAENP